MLLLWAVEIFYGWAIDRASFFLSLFSRDVVFLALRFGRIRLCNMRLEFCGVAFRSDSSSEAAVAVRSLVAGLLTPRKPVICFFADLEF